MYTSLHSISICEWKAYYALQSLHNFNLAYMHIQINSIGFGLKVYTNVCLPAVTGGGSTGGKCGFYDGTSMVGKSFISTDGCAVARRALK